MVSWTLEPETGHVRWRARVTGAWVARQRTSRFDAKPVRVRKRARIRSSMIQQREDKGRKWVKKEAKNKPYNALFNNAEDVRVLGDS